MEEALDAYNHSRVGIGAMLRKVATEFDLEGEERSQVLAFATTFDQLAGQVPEPDPASEAFRNFDYRVGMSFAAVAVYLNAHDALSEQFHRGRKDPESTVGRYLAGLDARRQAYNDLVARWEVRVAEACD
jgi:hypothetical protein